MITLYSGTPGSGKSLHQAEAIYWWLKAGHPCICNFDVNISEIKSMRLGEFYYVDNSILKPELLIKYSQLYFRNRKFKEGAIRLYIDECQLLFNAREWNTNGRSEWLSFFSQHRKYGYDIILIAQFDRMLDRQIRSLIEYEVVHRKVSRYGWFGWLISLIFGGNLFVGVEVWYPMKERVGATYYIGKKRLFRMYNTLNTFD